MGPQGVPLQSSTDAEVTFQPKDPPPSAGSVLAIYETDPKVAKDARELVWVIQGRSTIFNLVERKAGLTQEQLEDAVECHVEEAGCDTTGWSLIDIGLTGSALLIDGPNTSTPISTSVSWLDDGVEFLLFGPAGKFSKDEAIAAAKAMAST
jgi:hypothetical protein